MYINSEKEKAREHWLNKAAYEIDAVIFNSSLGTFETKFQCTWGRIKSNKQCESVDPRDYPNLSISDFFPITIAISWELKDPKEILLALAYEMCKVFGDAKRGKSFHKNLEKWYFDMPYNEPHATFILDEKIDKVYENMKRIYGDWPGVSLTIPKKEKTCHKSNIVTYICPECGIEIKCDKRKIKQSGTFTCICGAKMAETHDDLENIETPTQEQGSKIVAEILETSNNSNNSNNDQQNIKKTSRKEQLSAVYERSGVQTKNIKVRAHCNKTNQKITNNKKNIQKRSSSQKTTPKKRLSLRVSAQDMEDFPVSSLKVSPFYVDLYNIKSKTGSDIQKSNEVLFNKQQVIKYTIHKKRDVDIDF